MPSSFSIERMSASKIDEALLLCRNAGWNQIRSDWQRLISYEPEGCFAAIRNEELIGTVTTTRYGTELAWIGMMLVHPEYRRQGVATALMQRSIDYLRGHGVRCIKLDATADGEKVYRRMGFDFEWSFSRYCREGTKAGMQCDVDESHELPVSMLRYDRDAFGANRQSYLRLLAADSVLRIQSDGYGLMRPGFLACYLGPVIAQSPSVANSIVQDLCKTTGRTIFWDIPGPNREAVGIAHQLSFEPVRQLARMHLGPLPSGGDIDLQYGLADPGTG